MAIPKYKKQFDEMVSNNKELFDDIKTLDKNSDKFKELQRNLLRIVRRNEDILCSKTQNTYSNFSSGLADKFLSEVQTHYPEIYIS